MKHDEQNSTRGERSPLALVLLAAFGAGVAGGLVAHWMVGDAGVRSDEPVSPGDRDGLAKVAAEVHALAQSVDALARQPTPGVPSGETAAHSPEPLRPEPTAALEAAITRLVETLGNAGGQRPAVADRGSLQLPDDPQAARSKLLALRSRDPTAVKQEHLLMSMQEIVQRYGIPDRVSVDSPIVYLIWKDTDSQEILVRTYDGIVVSIELPR